MPYTVDITIVPSRTVAVTTFHVTRDELDDMSEQMGRAFDSVMAALDRSGLVAGGPAVACYRPTADGFDVCAGFDVDGGFEPGDGVEVLVLPAGTVAHTTHMGGYDELPAAYEALKIGAQEQGRTVDEDASMVEEYWTGPDAPREQTRTEVYWPVTAT